MEFKVQRTGKSPLAFDGEKIAEATTQNLRSKEQSRWYEIAIYECDKYLIAAVVFESCWQGETPFYWAEVFSSMAEVSRWLSSLNAIPPRIGWPPRPEYDERQRLLIEDLNSQYRYAVSEVLREFPQAPEVSAQDDYAAMDHECTRDWVATELSEINFTKKVWMAICDANNGAMLIPGCWQVIGPNLEDSPELDEKWGVSTRQIARQIAALTRGQQFAIAYAVAQFWRHCDLSTDDALAKAGVPFNG